MEDKLRRDTIPVVILRDSVVFPMINQQIDVVRKLSILSINCAVSNNTNVIIVQQRDSSVDEPGFNDIYTYGVVATIHQIIKSASSELIRVRVETLFRCRIEAMTKKDGILVGSYTECAETPVDDPSRLNALSRSLRDAHKSYMRTKSAKQSRTITDFLFTGKDLGRIIDIVVHNTFLPGEKKQLLLNELNHARRCETAIAMLYSEIEIAKLQQQIESQVRENIEQTQKEYYLREQLKVIGEQLSDGDSPAHESEELRSKILAMKLPENIEAQLLKVCSKLAKLPFGSHEASVERNYLDACLSLPWGIRTKEKANVSAAQKKLNRDHYGLEKVKERILEFIAVRSLAPGIKGQIICLAGPPGVGKTSIARSIAEALGRKYCRLSLGGVHDEADIRGHRRTYIGAMPGRVINALKLAGSSNPLILLDEVDKLSSDYRGDPASALLELLDPEQNSTFHDHYIDMPFDLSDVLFITTANDQSAIPGPLLDRMEIINLPSYTLEEKKQIARHHLIKKQLKNHGLTGTQLRFDDDGIIALIEGYTSEAGVRSLEREIASICRKTAKSIISRDCESVRITPTTLEKLLGPAKYKPEQPDFCSEPGIANGLAYTSVGGTMLEIEVAVLSGTGKLELTGSMGDVMKESARIAVSYIRSQCDNLGIDPDFYKTKDIHIHVPEGATPKDGPSAGITMTCAIISALTGIPVRSDTAMTGEVTLRGRVLPIGGLREKTMAAYKHSIKTVIIPEGNKADIAQLSEKVRSSLEFVIAKNMSDVLAAALTVPPVTDSISMPIIDSIGGIHESSESIL